MRKPILKYIITLFFTVALLIPRIANLHALNHLSEDGEPLISCELCDIISSSDQFDLIIGDTYSFEDQLQIVPNSFIVFSEYNTPKEKIASPVSIYNKPPPLS
ncbi:hypothetical protein AWE51_25250 [Aquimarina aggregata]|uniref:Uncharacterized protein n=1 Tax=Aquimarina aggregata TaxID=1642818 RepID=A0A162ZZC5_9FLAO|nr:hypothetical protein [Aquimarina aggregata]KZS40152.1 hypothetical protein AWE51_25250 [Aquimarina aggregata]